MLLQQKEKDYGFLKHLKGQVYPFIINGVKPIWLLAAYYPLYQLLLMIMYFMFVSHCNIVFLYFMSITIMIRLLASIFNVTTPLGIV